MSVQTTYPGVYIEELSSGVHTITGVSTSITAFAGWAPMGSNTQAELVLSFSDFNRRFGGIDARSLLGYAVYHFFSNGGSQAYIIRVTSKDDKSATASKDKLAITASSPGDWANNYGVTITNFTNSSGKKRFRLQVVQLSPLIVVENFENLSMDPDDPRFVDEVTVGESQLITTKSTAAAPFDPPADTSDPLPLKNGALGAVLGPNDGDFGTALLPTTEDGGVYLLDRVDLFNLLVVPGLEDVKVLNQLETFCSDPRRRAFLIADSASEATFDTLSKGPKSDLTSITGTNAAFYFPWIKAPDPLKQNRLRSFPPSGFIAGLYARTDSTRGVWKAPAGTEASLNGASGVTVSLTDDENGTLNPQAINCIRTFPVYGTISWGARTLQGNDQIGSEWKYIPVRRTALFIEESLFRGLKWVVFEPNDEPLWAQIRLNVGAFMQNLFRQGAFQGKTPQEAYFVKCDKDTTTQNDINLGIVNVVVGFAPLKPAEFVIVKIQQMAGQIQV